MAPFFTKKSANIGKMSQNFLHNRFVLYFIFFLAIANLFILVFSNDLKTIGVFFLTGLLTSFFSKNMVVIMVVSMVVANIIKIGTNSRDGFQGDDDEDDDKEKKDGFRKAADDDEEEEKDDEPFGDADEDADEDDKEE
jgi:hypothetical protein